MLLGGVMGGITPTTWIVIRLLQFKTFLPFTLFSCLLLPFKTYNKCGYDNFWEGYLSAEWKIFSNLWGNIFHVGGCGLVLTGCCDWESDLARPVPGCDIKYKESHVSLSVLSVSITVITAPQPSHSFISPLSTLTFCWASSTEIFSNV